MRTNLSMYVTGPINVDLWNEAKWRGTVFLHYPGEPPILGLGFLNENPARQIFEEWHKRYGDRDAFEELRVSIVEGEIKGEQPGYTVHISVDFENTSRPREVYLHDGQSSEPNESNSRLEKPRNV